MMSLYNPQYLVKQKYLNKLCSRKPVISSYYKPFCPALKYFIKFKPSRINYYFKY